LQPRVIRIVATNPSNNMSDYQIIDTNADDIGGDCHCGNQNASNLGHRRKTNWLRKRYVEGLSYKVLRSEKSGDVGMIEYVLGNHAWRSVEAEGYPLSLACPSHGTGPASLQVSRVMQAVELQRVTERVFLPV
jgi:hypothetical protein